MKTFIFMRKAIAIVCFIILAYSASSQNNPINCDGKFFVSHGAGTQITDASSLETLSFSSGGTITTTSYPVNPANLGYNAIGLNPIDGYMYAISYLSSSTVQLIRIGAGGTNVNNIGQLNSSSAGNPINSNVYAGCFDASGNYYFIDNNNNFFKLTTAQLAGGSQTRTATYLGTLSGSGNNAPPDLSSGKIIDIAVNPIDGKMYGVSMGPNSSTVKDYRLYQISATGALTRQGSSSGTAGQYPHTVSGTNYYVAALFFGEDGTLYGYRSNGTFLKFDLTNPNLSTSVGTGPSYTAADGCNCSFRVGHTLAPVTFCPSSVNPNDPTNNKIITVTISNGSGAYRGQLTYSLDISDPAKRLRFTESAATIAQNLFNQGLLSNNNPSQVVLSTVAPATGTNYNKIDIKPTAAATDGFSVPFGATSYTFSLAIQLYTFGGAYNPVSVQSVISGLPSGMGTTDLSGNGSQPHAKTDISFCNTLTLPVRLLSFSGSYKNNAALLNWESASEVNFSYFQVERSINGIDFSDIALQPSQESGSSQELYNYTDNLAYLSSDVFYYRLKMVDVDGKFSYSNVIMIRKEQKADDALSVSPNPLIKSDIATLRINAAANNKVDIKLIDMNGKVVLTQQNQVSQGINSIAINNLNRLQPGIYTVQLTNGDAIYNTKLSIIR